MLTRDEMIKEYRNRAGTWYGLAIVYFSLIGAMVLAGTAMT